VLGSILCVLQISVTFLVAISGAIWLNCYYHKYSVEYLWKRYFLISASVLVVITVFLRILTILKIFEW